MRPPGIVCAAAWLTVTASLLSLAAAEPSAPESSLHDALSSAALPPVLAADIPPVDAESWALLLERARKAVESESRKEHRADGVQVVRETFFVPLRSPNVGASDATPAVGAAVAGSNAPSKTQEQAEPANILKTVAKLRGAADRFPFRTSLARVALTLFPQCSARSSSTPYTTLSASSTPTPSSLSCPSSSASSGPSSRLSPSSSRHSSSRPSLSPARSSAPSPRCGTPSRAHSRAGPRAAASRARRRASTRVALDETLAVTTRAGRWLGVLPKEGAGAEVKASRREEQGGFGAGVRFERFAPGAPR